MSDGYSIGEDESGNDIVVFAPGLPFCHGLKMCPREIETELLIGNWLVLAYAVWSKPDMDCIDVAIEVTKQLAGQLSLGVRPFNRFDEFRSWCPSAIPHGQSPVWIYFQSGGIIWSHFGVLSAQQLKDKLTN